MELTNKWVRSVKSEYGNMAFDSNGLMNRGFAVQGNRIYVVGRDAGSSTASVYIDHYSTDTGERIKRVAVDDAVKGLYYPGNDIFADAAGNLCISNLSSLNSIISKADKKMYSIKAEKKDSRANINVIE